MLEVLVTIDRGLAVLLRTSEPRIGDLALQQQPSAVKWTRTYRARSPIEPYFTGHDREMTTAIAPGTGTLRQAQRTSGLQKSKHGFLEDRQILFDYSPDDFEVDSK